MKNLLQVFINDEGELDFLAENEDWLDGKWSQDNLKQSMAFFNSILSKMVDRIWGESDTCVSKVIRLLSMAEMCACSEPYVQAEEFWSMMMFDFIPYIEKYADSLKTKFGYDPDAKQRPFVAGDTSLFGKILPTRFN